MARPYFGWWLVGAAFVAQFVSTGMQNYIIGPFMGPMTAALDWTRTDFTLARTIGQFVLAAVGVVAGGLVDRHGGRPLMLGGGAVLAAALWGCGRVTELWQWLVLNGVALSVGAALVGNLVVNVTLAKWFVTLRGRAVALAAMGVSFAGVVLTPLTTVAIERLGWRDAWTVLAGLVLLLVLPVALVMRRTPEDHGWHPDGRSDAEVAAGAAQRAADDLARSLTRSEAMRTFTFYALVVAFGLFVINIGVMLLQTVPFLVDGGFDPIDAALMITVASVPALLSKPVWGHFIDRIEGRPLAAGGAFLTGSALLLITASVALQQPVAVAAGYFLLGCGWGGMIPLQEVIWASYFGRRHIGAVRGAAMPFTLAFGATAPIAVSYWHDVSGSYSAALYAVAALNLLSGGLILGLPRQRVPPGA